VNSGHEIEIKVVNGGHETEINAVHRLDEQTKLLFNDILLNNANNKFNDEREQFEDH
ncbi:7700_t:CDS:2, partial [Entrophospora sp. SA101]